MAELTGCTSRLVDWFHVNGLAGWDPYDLKGTSLAMLLGKQKSALGRKLNATYLKLGERYPLGMRRVMGVTPEINAKGVGLLLDSCAILESLEHDHRVRAMGDMAAQWLLDNCRTRYAGRNWGYPFDWQSVILIPGGTPSAVVSSIVCQGFHQWFKLTGDERHLAVCNDICTFFLTDLNRTVDEPDRLCFSYTPLDDFQVHNANLMVAQCLVQTGLALGRDDYVETGLRCCRFALSEQQDEGFIPYWSLAQSHNTGGLFTDHYHCGFEIRMLHSVGGLTGDSDIADAAKRYFHWYDREMYTPSGVPRLRTCFRDEYPVNVHTVAEAILCRAVVASEYGLGQERVTDVIGWAEDVVEYAPGEFTYLMTRDSEGRVHRADIPMLRWGQAWMLRAMAEYERTRNRLDGWN